MGISNKYNKDEFVRRANLVHNNKYDYSLSDYKNSRDKIDILCPKHGIFRQMPYNHLQGKGCNYCSMNQKNTINDFIDKSNKKHNSKYNYPDKNYINSVTQISIECPNHGVFRQTPGNHLRGVGCPKCSGNRKLTTDEFIDKANKKHNFLYKYPNLNYKNYDSEIDIECPKHGIFKQIVRNHLTGRGCQKCRNSKGELKISEILSKNNIKYKKEYTFNDLRHKDLLKFDFAILDDKELIKYLIEFNGQQHYDFKKKFHKDYDNFIINKHRDNLKIDYCRRNGYKLYIIRYDDNIEDIMNNILNDNM